MNEETEKRKKIGVAFKESENKFESMIAAVKDAIILVDNDGKIDFLNDAAERMFGYSRQEIMNKNLNFILTPEKYHDAYIKAFSKFKTTGDGLMIGKTIELEAKRNDGCIFPIELSLSALTIKGKWHATGIIRDITSRRQDEEKLKSQNEYIKLVINSFTTPFYVINVKDYTIAMANTAICAPGEEGETCYAITHKRNKPCGHKEHKCPLEEVTRTKKPATLEHLHLDLNGESRIMEIHCFPIFDREGNVVQVIEYSLDITESRKTQEAVRESERSFRTLAENIPGIAYRVFKCENDRMKIYSKNSTDITGYSELELESGEEHSINNLILSNDRPKVKEEIEKAIGEKRTFSIAYRLLHKDGSTRYLVDQGRPIFGNDEKLLYTDGVIFDTTQRKLKEEEYENLATIVETATDFIGIANFDGRLHYINPAGRKMLGISLNEDISTLDIPTLFPENAQNIFMNEAIPTAIISGVWKGEMNMMSREGKEIPVSQALVAHKTLEDKIAFFFTIARDITDRKRIEKELILAKDEALLSNSVKSEFLTKMSHELRTPLNAVMGFSEILRMKTMGELNEKQEQYVNFISQSGKRLLVIINDILDLVKLESGEKLPLSIQSFLASEAIEEVLIFVNEKAENRKIIIQKEIEPGLGMIKADKLRFKQILINIIDNAIKFSKPDGGTITIMAGKDGDMAKFLISDTGIGIREEDLGKLFGLFHQIDSGINRSYGGTGIGLAITKQLVEQQEGKMWVKSKIGEGSTFGFTMPLEMKMQG